MYFDWRLWAMMAGLRLRVAGAVGLGLLAMGFGILRFVFLGRMLALAFRGAPIGAIGMAAAGTAVCILLRAALDHARPSWRRAPPGRCRCGCAPVCSTGLRSWGRPGSERNVQAA